MEEVSQDSTEAATCVICTQSMCDGGRLHKLRCSHTFHTECVVRWFRTASNRTSCPVCRGEEGASASAASPDAEEGGDADDASSLGTLEVPLTERDMNGLLSDHLNYGRRNACPRPVKTKIRRYRAARDKMKRVRGELYRHEREGFGRYVDLRRVSMRITSRLVTAQERFIERAMELLEEPIGDGLGRH
jgi:hypothetical protein